MEDHGQLQRFAEEFGKILWKELGGKAEVSLDVVSGQNCEGVVVFVVKENGSPVFIREITEGFAQMQVKFGGDMNRYAAHLAKEIKFRNDFGKS